MAVANLRATPTAVGASQVVAWTDFLTNNGSVFATAATNGGAVSNTSGNQFIMVREPGIVMMWVGVEWDTPNVGQQVDVQPLTVGGLFEHVASGDNVITDATNETATVDKELMAVANGVEPAYFRVLLSNGNASNASVECALWYLFGSDLALIY